MCLTCGCNDAHKPMGKNITYEELRDVAADNGQTVDQALETMRATAAADRQKHVEEYAESWQANQAR